MKIEIKRSKHNPIVVPGKYTWRKATSFNPGVVYDDGRFLMYERATASLRPFKSSIGLLESQDGVHFEHVLDTPVFTAEMLGFPGSVEDARVVKIEGVFYLCYALEPYLHDCWPNGVTVPEYSVENYPEWEEHGLRPCQTRSGIARSTDGIHFEHLCYVTPQEIDDRDLVLFPEKINDKFAVLRRPKNFPGDKYGADKPGIWISFSEDMMSWSDPELVAVAEEAEWEGGKIGGSGSPVKTEDGWLILYHGVDQTSTYRVGAMLLDLEEPQKVIARTKNFIMEPTFYYERFGVVIPNVVFPTANVVVEDILYIYYGCCDTSIGLATVPLSDLLEYILHSE